MASSVAALGRAQLQNPPILDWRSTQSYYNYGPTPGSRSSSQNSPQDLPPSGQSNQLFNQPIPTPARQLAQATFTQTTHRVLGSVPENNTSLVNAVYYPSWSVYASRPPSTLNFACITHVFYAFVWPNPDGTFSYSEEDADLEAEVDNTQGAINSLMHQRAQHPNLRVILSIGGGGRGSEAFATVAANPALRLVFARNLWELVQLHNFDGVDIDWEHPENRQQGVDYVELLRAVRSEFPYPRYIVTSALPCGSWVLDNIDIEAAVSWLDYLNLMAYDFSGPWTPLSGHQSQLWSPDPPHDDNAILSCYTAVAYLANRNIPKRKILLGVPVFGRAFEGTENVGQPWPRNDITILYRDLPRAGAQEWVDEDVGATFSVGGGEGFVSYDNPQTVEMKAKFVRQEGLGGLFYWNSSGDANGGRSLVYTGFQALRGP